MMGGPVVLYTAGVLLLLLFIHLNNQRKEYYACDELGYCKKFPIMCGLCIYLKPLRIFII